MIFNFKPKEYCFSSAIPDNFVMTGFQGDVKSELSDLSNATNRVKFNWKQVKKQRVMVGATPKRIFNNTYNNNFS